MTTVKDIYDNEIYDFEELEGLDDNIPIVYEVWAIGRDSEGAITDSEMLIDKFDNPEKAVAYAKALTLADIIFKAAESKEAYTVNDDVASITVEVETVVEGEDGVMNVGTIYHNEVFSREDLVLKEEDYYVDINTNALVVKCQKLVDFKEGDYVKVAFTDTCLDAALTYKITSLNDVEGVLEFIC